MIVYEYHNGMIGVRSKWLFTRSEEDGSGLISKGAYEQAIHRGSLISLRRGCYNTPSLVKFTEDMYNDLYNRIIAIAGRPKDNLTRNILEEIITIDQQAVQFYGDFRTDNNSSLVYTTQKKYVHTASILNGVRILINEHLSKARALGQGKTRMWKNISQSVNALSKFTPHFVPSSPRKLQHKFKIYIESSYAGLLHGGLNNENSQKIVGDIADWWLAHYSMPNKPMIPVLMSKYKSIREENNWPTLSESGVIIWLNKPDNKRLWYISRHGVKEYKNKFGYKISRNRDNWFPNAYWGIDGTKLDWLHYYDNKLKMAAKLKIDPVFDIFSEKILGWSYSESENHIDHFTALKHASVTAGARPLLITYDGQSGHTSPKMQDIYNHLVAKNGGTHYKHQAYRSSNPTEQLFSRFQQQVLNQYWASDKQSITSKSVNSRPNMDFIKKFKHKLKSREELIAVWEYCVDLWNEMPHPRYKDKSRNEVYEMEAPMKESIDLSEMVEIFWIKETKSIKYRAEGLKLKVAGVDYWYEVYDENGKIDLEFRRKNVGNSFQVRYDPQLMEKGVQLWNITPAGKSYAGIAEPKRKHESIPALQKEGARAIFNEDFITVNRETARDLQAITEIQERVNITPEQLIEEQELIIKMHGVVPKEMRSKAEEVNFLNRI